MPVIPTVRARRCVFDRLPLPPFRLGRRPGDDVVDIILRIAMGRLCWPPFQWQGFGCSNFTAPIGMFTITDRAPINATMFNNEFPYLNVPVPGSRLPVDGPLVQPAP